jgi:hypothetical protein
LPALLALAVGLSFVLGGRAFSWCPWMQRAVTTDCCRAPQKEANERPAFERKNCCETKVVPTTPPVSAERNALTDLGSAVAALPPEPHLTFAFERDAVRDVFASPRERGARAGPKVPLYAQNCAYLI